MVFPQCACQSQLQQSAKRYPCYKRVSRNVFENLLLGTRHELKNRYLHVDFREDTVIQSANDKISKCQNGTLDCTLEELAVLRTIAANPSITQKELAAAIGKSERTIKRRMTDLQEKGYLRREGGKRSGHWEVLVEIS